MPTNPESILSSTKDALGLLDEDTSFDDAIKLYINSTLATINQLGIGPEEGLTIDDDTTTWSDLIGREKRYEGVKGYMYLCVRMLFDPPQVGYVITAMKDMKEQAEWRLNRAREDIVYPMTPKVDRTTTLITDGSDLDTQATRLRPRAGIPFAKSIRITNGKEVWPDLESLEARMQIRLTKDSASEVQYDFSPHLSKAFDGNDILIAWALSGEQTRLLKPGYYDLVVSDAGPTDARAIRIIYGFLSVDSLVTT